MRNFNGNMFTGSPLCVELKNRIFSNLIPSSVNQSLEPQGTDYGGDSIYLLVNFFMLGLFLRFENTNGI